uniref:Uncharacterized protein n=1 Tax=Tanacetum cinerariifolium TaxID=118510 RepID=A0A699I0J1_TANCI|nr:hypothetical protein [Tanacetum cinerariifolium]
MVATRNTSIEHVVEPHVQNWVNTQINDQLTRFREEVTVIVQNTIAAALSGPAGDVLRRNGEGRGIQPQFTRMTKIEFPKFGDPIDTCHDDSILEPGEDIVEEEGTGEIIEFTPQISLHALNGVESFQTMRVTGHVGRYTWGSSNLSKQFAWKMHGEDFMVDAMVLPLGGCDMVLRGTRKSGVQWMEGSRVPDQTAQLSSMVLCVYPSTTMNTISASTIEGIPFPIFTLLSHFDDVFVVPTSLPPMREYDHKIVPKKGTEPIFSRPYRHPPTQKDAIEVMVKELLDSGVIRPSQIPFSSLVVMVKKKDGTWRMCIDYKKLNEQTIKDKFHIPIIKELSDVLQDSQYFSKLDSRSGYHQIRMCQDDVEKTAFRTHEGHYEFLVMAFGLTNAPSTFQALMNFVFKEYLRKFVLVFFDYILVYSPDLRSHVKHLELVLLLLSQHTLFARKSKCVFRSRRVKYLEAMMNASVLKLPNFEEVFIVETDASREGIGAVLQQAGHPIAYYSKTLAPRHHNLSTYEKELLAVIHVLHKITTPAQMKWLPKLMGFDYEIMYKKGNENEAADALSRVNTGGQLLHMVLTFVSSELLPKIKESWSKDPSLKSLIDKIKAGKPDTGVEATTQRIQGFCYWKKLRKQVKEFVSTCAVCQKSKADLSAYSGLLQPLPIPTLIWSEILMYFIEGLSNSGGKTVIISGRDKVFLSLFWKEFFKMLQVSLHLSTAYHPQTDGQTRVVNRCLECYLRCMTRERPKEWSKWLALAKYCKVDSVDRSLAAREAIIQMLQFHLPRAQVRMKAVADTHRTESIFDVRQWMWLKLQPHRQISVRKGKYNKLLPMYYGTFQILTELGMAAYKLQLPPTAQIHPVFHVSQLKLFKGDPLAVQEVLPKCDPNGHLACVPIKVLERRMIKEHNKLVVYVLIQWSYGSQADATWELATNLKKRFPDFSFDS